MLSKFKKQSVYIVSLVGRILNFLIASCTVLWQVIYKIVGQTIIWKSKHTVYVSFDLFCKSKKYKSEEFFFRLFIDVQKGRNKLQLLFSLRPNIFLVKTRPKKYTITIQLTNGLALGQWRG